MKHSGIYHPLQLVQFGPLVNVTLRAHPTAVAAGNAAAPLPATMMVDTGARKTVIEKRIASQLSLTPIRFENMVGVSQKPEPCPVYLLELEIGMSEPGKTAAVRFGCEVIGMASPPTPQPHVGLIGRDVLSSVKLVYDGPSGQFEIVAPSNLFATSPTMPPGQAATIPTGILPPPAKVVAEPAPAAAGKVPQNAQCPCGSGKKYKKCHGK